MTGEWLVVRQADGRVMCDFDTEAEARLALADNEEDDTSAYVVARVTPARPVEGGEAVADWYSVAIDGEKDAQVAFRSRAAAERYVARWHPDCMVAVIVPVRAAPPAPQVTEAMAKLERSIRCLAEQRNAADRKAALDETLERLGSLTAALRGGQP